MDCPDYRIQLDAVHSGYDRKTCWVHPRAGTIPGENPIVVMTMQKLKLTGSDLFFELNEMRTDDMGRTWSGPVPHSQMLGRRRESGGIEVAINDFTPMWHKASGKLLGTGQCTRYIGDNIMPDPRPRQTAYSIYEPEKRAWSDWDVVDMPDKKKFFSAGAGSTQRFDLEDGDILLPIYVRTPDFSSLFSTVMRCSFDGEILRYVEHGDELIVPESRGLGEPSLTRHGDEFFLTLRNDVRGYVARSRDGLHFEKPKDWIFDDGSELGNYNTQQHWVTHPKGLFLVYTRRGAGNDHVFRHRAPLFMAQVDPERLCVIRRTERILVPNRGARLGNFAVTKVNGEETWVTVAEWMQTIGPDPHDCTRCEKYGSDNTVFVSRIIWSA
ncbi:MAG TPA: sialidase [Lentisphaeria bacterium]|nr:sialidase [Lentisphaeria bacterium]